MATRNYLQLNPTITSIGNPKKKFLAQKFRSFQTGKLNLRLRVWMWFEVVTFDSP